VNPDAPTMPKDWHYYLPRQTNKNLRPTRVMDSASFPSFQEPDPHTCRLIVEDRPVDMNPGEDKSKRSRQLQEIVAESGIKEKTEQALFQWVKECVKGCSIFNLKTLVCQNYPSNWNSLKDVLEDSSGVELQPTQEETVWQIIRKEQAS
jgi:hypothetical protein